MTDGGDIYGEEPGTFNNRFGLTREVDATGLIVAWARGRTDALGTPYWMALCAAAGLERSLERQKI